MLSRIPRFPLDAAWIVLTSVVVVTTVVAANTTDELAPVAFEG